MSVACLGNPAPAQQQPEQRKSSLDACWAQRRYRRVQRHTRQIRHLASSGGYHCQSQPGAKFYGAAHGAAFSCFALSPFLVLALVSGLLLVPYRSWVPLLSLPTPFFNTSSPE
ncbi:hypothetical protein F5Y08DRAFT_339816 [Xylaria arbuscula]|nr:hypothetical protein F5Y08DRAFT_339816 [Xylaria arbuscula]